MVRREAAASRLDAVLSCQIRELVGRFTPQAAPLLLDEAFPDVAGNEHLFNSTTEIRQKIKQTVRQEVRLAASVDVARFGISSWNSLKAHAYGHVFPITTEAGIKMVLDVVAGIRIQRHVPALVSPH